MSSQGSSRLWINAAGLFASAAFVFVLAAPAQYPGQIAKPETDAPDLRAVAVFEWTGDEAHPKAARLVPICVYDGQDLNDAGIYLTHPEPLALESDVEYQLQRDGSPVGLFDIETSARGQGGWFGYGKWRPLPKAKAAPTQVAKIDAEDDAQSDVPILHRKHHAGDSGGSGGSGSPSGSGANSGSGSSGPAPDPDRPTLHKGGDTSSASSGTSSGSPGQAGSGSGPGSGSGSNSGGDANAPPSDPDRPVLRRTDSSASGDGTGNGSSSESGGDSGHPKLKKKSKDDDAGYVEDVASAADPNRPHLSYSKFAGYGAPVVPTLLGLQADMQQTVAVSDATDHPAHIWNYIWANPDDEGKMRSAMEDAARSALGLNPPLAPKRTPRTAATHKAKPTAPTSAPAPAPLLVEKFRVFELAYGSGATMVLSAHTADAGANEKFVTLIAQPDLYGGVNVLVKSVTDAAHLDDTPRMRLVDAVEAENDNRGELLFELRGTTERQFALFRVLRGDATRIFLSGPESIATPVAN